MVQKKPRVSLCMPVFNGENYIAHALDSIAAQTFDDYEVIVSDNASTDRTQAIVQARAAADPRIRYVRNEQNLGAARNYNIGFELARGEYLKWFAHDDAISSNFLALMVAELDRQPATSLAFGRTVSIGEDGVEIAEFGARMQPVQDDDAVVRYFRTLTSSGSCYPIFGLFRMADLRRSCLHRPYYGSDRALLAEVAVMGKLAIVPDAVFYNRVHRQRSVNISNRAQRDVWQNGTASRMSSAERLSLLGHLFAICRRHPDAVAPWRLRLTTLRYALRPIELGRYAIELVGLVSPRAAAGLRAPARMVWGAVSVPRKNGSG
ncbi:MAG: glycosyltransferase family 2 protein [Paracoccaceae bacterium]